MRLSLAKSLLLSSAALLSPVGAEDQILQSNSLNSCQENSGFQASLFKVQYIPRTGVASINIVAVSSVQGSVIFDVALSAYGYTFLKKKVDPCDAGLAGLCPMVA